MSNCLLGNFNPNFYICYNILKENVYLLGIDLQQTKDACFPTPFFPYTPPYFSPFICQECVGTCSLGCGRQVCLKYAQNLNIFTYPQLYCKTILNLCSMGMDLTTSNMLRHIAYKRQVY